MSALMLSKCCCGGGGVFCENSGDITVGVGATFNVYPDCLPQRVLFEARGDNPYIDRRCSMILFTRSGSGQGSAATAGPWDAVNPYSASEVQAAFGVGPLVSYGITQVSLQPTYRHVAVSIARTSMSSGAISTAIALAAVSCFSCWIIERS